MEENGRNWVDYTDEEKLLVIDGYLDGVVALDDENEKINKQRLEWLKGHIPAYRVKGGKNYIFVSYSHLDYKEVYKDLAAFSYNSQRRVRFWYDEGLPIGQDWEKIAGSIIKNPHCIGVLFYLSKNLLLSPSVFKEIECVKNLGKAYFTIAIDDESYSAGNIFDHIMGSELRAVRDRQQELEDFFPANNTALISYGNDNVLARIDKIAEQFDVTEEVFSDFVCEECEGGLKLVAYRGNKTEVRIPEKIGDKNIVEVAAGFPHAVLLYIPKSVTSIDCMAFDDSVNLEEIVVDKDNPRYYDVNGVLCDGSFAYEFRERCEDSFVWKEKKGKAIVRVPVLWNWKKQFVNYQSVNQIDLFDKLIRATSDDERDKSPKERAEFMKALVDLLGDFGVSLGDVTYEDKYLNKFEELFGFLLAYLNDGELNKSEIAYAVIYKKTDVLYNALKSLKGFSAFTKIDYIGENAFKNCKKVPYLFLSDNISEICNSAFKNSNLILIYLPSHLKTVNGLFCNCGDLQSVLTDTDYYDTHSEQNFDKALLLGEIEGLSGSAFRNTAISGVELGSDICETWGAEFAECIWLREVVVPGKICTLTNMFAKCLRLQKVVLEDGVENIKWRCFSDCVCLKYIKIPKSVKFIEDTCFDGCENLETIEYGGTMEEWRALENAVNELSLYGNWKSQGEGVKIICTDGVIEPSQKN